MDALSFCPSCGQSLLKANLTRQTTEQFAFGSTDYSSRSHSFDDPWETSVEYQAKCKCGKVFAIHIQKEPVGQGGGRELGYAQLFLPEATYQGDPTEALFTRRKAVLKERGRQLEYDAKEKKSEDQKVS